MMTYKNQWQIAGLPGGTITLSLAFSDLIIAPKNLIPDFQSGSFRKRVSERFLKDGSIALFLWSLFL